MGKPLTVEEGKQAAEYWLQLLEDSLKDLDVDYVDAYYLMAIGDAAILKSEELYAAFLKAKEAGKVGHWGVSTHKDAQAIMPAMIETGWYDLAMIAVTPAGWYDWDTKGLLEGTSDMKTLQPILAQARGAGIGLVGMKAARFLAGAAALGKGDDAAFDSHYDAKLMESGLSGIQRSYAYVLENGVDVVNADMQSFEHMEANLQVARASAEYFA
jgi:aryl-alcohol dehydrogenase-like predicted oxidoreductase